ncbi:MAG: DUF3299 domain-containing protein [Gammaproteobacteria bacterium]|jgi:hypothetical protein|nr:MAG: DUF3299 domain-containing protein [Gammaproteobacteria bacterium]
MISRYEPSWGHWSLLILLSLSALSAPATTSESSEAPHENYRVLDWKDLVPEDWEPPLVATAFDEGAETGVDEASVVQDLDGQLAALPGYMKPVVFEGNQVTEFLLVPFLPHQTRAHAHLEANQMVYVYALEPVTVEQPFEPIWIVGALSLEPVMTDEGPAAYRMVEAVTTPYEY